MPRTINQFMWGFQPHFRYGVQREVENCLSLIGLPVEVHVILVGFALDSNPRHQSALNPRMAPSLSMI